MSREDQEPSCTARVGVGLEHALDTDPRPILEIVPGAAPGASLGIMLGLTVKATIMVTHGAYVPGPQMNIHPKGE